MATDIRTEQRASVPAAEDAIVHAEAHTPTAIMLAVVIVPFVGLLVAIAMLWGRAVSAHDLVLLAALYVPAALGITVGYHRMLTHKAFVAPAAVRAVFLAFGAMALEGGPIAWAVDHRTHHAFSDKPGDPHSPHAEHGPGFRAAVAGLWHAHAGWLFDTSRRRGVERYGKDLLQDPVALFFERTFLFWAVLGFIVPALVGLAITGDLRGLATGLLWGGLVRVFLNHHITWSINSICHYFGKRPFRSADRSTNNWLLALPSMGESWHHNHHAFPTSAFHGLKRSQIDVSGLVIAALAKVGLAREVRRPTPEQMARKLADRATRPE